MEKINRPDQKVWGGTDKGRDRRPIIPSHHLPERPSRPRDRATDAAMREVAETLLHDDSVEQKAAIGLNTDIHIPDTEVPSRRLVLHPKTLKPYSLRPGASLLYPLESLPTEHTGGRHNATRHDFYQSQLILKISERKDKPIGY